MDYRRLGKTGLQISALSFGSWVTFSNQLDQDAAAACMEAARDAGVNFFDNAEAYASGEAESIMGKVLREKGWDRQDLIISTKIFFGGEGPNRRGLSRKHIVEGTQASLDRLGLSHVDLLFCHRPDPETPIEESVRAMSWAVDQGWTHYWGTSEWTPDQILKAKQVANQLGLHPPVMEQPQYNLFCRKRVEEELSPVYESPSGLGLTTWSPLASGILTGKYQDGIPKESRFHLEPYAWLAGELEGEEGAKKKETVTRLLSIASSLSCSLAQLALAFCLKNPRVSTVITGASRPTQVRENMKALDVAKTLTPSILRDIQTASALANDLD